MWLDRQHSKWTAPAFAVGLGVLIWGAAIVGGQPSVGLMFLVVMTLIGLGTLLGGRSETVRALRGDGADERFALIDLRATALTGLALTVAIIAAFTYELAAGRDGLQYAWLGAIGGLTYLVSIIVLRLRA
jgi:hypothetical protein